MGGIGRGAWAEDFRVESKVYVGKEVTTSVAVFNSGRVYDFISDPDEVTIFDPPGQKFVILNASRHVKTEVSLADVDQFAQKIKTEATARPVPLLVFLAAPTFEESFDEATGMLTLTSEWMDYEVKTAKPRHAGAASMYADFSNWQTKLNAMMNPGSLPPFARLSLNAALDRQQRLPTEVLLTRYAQSAGNRQVSIRAEHHVTWRLDDSDFKRIDAAGDELVTARAVGLAEYRASVATAATK